MDPGCVDLFHAAIQEAEQKMEIGIGLAILDTYNKGIAYGGGDEDRAKDQNRALGHLRRLQERYDGLHVALVGHTGKDESRGARGSNAFLGDADVQTQISTQGDVKIVTTTKGNDQGNGELLRFKLEPYQLGADEDGDPIEVWITSNELIEAVAPERARRAPVRLRPRQQNALDCLVQAAAGGINSPASLGLPVGYMVARLDQWKAELLRRGIIPPDSRNPSRDFADLRQALQAKRLAMVDGDYAWPLS